ncbi:hypothetical protein CSPX01_15271 [Colletotrichum filicis]|nr:hypothetical protein CSPX01_15271 [Colletotrichum filicis]
MPLSHLFTLPVTCLREANAAPHWQLQLGMVVSAQTLSSVSSHQDTYKGHTGFWSFTDLELLTTFHIPARDPGRPESPPMFSL